VVAEGVESPEQLEFLRQHQCDEIQGFLISRPLEAEALVAFLGAAARADAQHAPAEGLSR
jgi:EAL domain-containing protein (putative c-di-GMP-specific phosphodiesterase class I)